MKNEDRITFKKYIEKNKLLNIKDLNSKIVIEKINL